MAIFDIHSHFLPVEYRTALQKAGRLQEDGFPCPDWSLDAHRAYLDEAGIDACLLSISSPHQMLSPAADGLALTRQLNSRAAAICAQEPKRFRFAACLPLPLMEESVNEAIRALDTLGARAVKLPTNAGGLYPGDPAMEPLYSALDARNAVILLHPCKPPAYPARCFTAGPLPLFEFLSDTTRAVIDLLTANVPARYPNLRFVVPHTGSFLPQVIDRLSGITQVMAARGAGQPIDARAQLGSFYFDLAGDALPAALPALATLTTADHLLFGGDFPYTPAARVKANIEALRQSPLIAPFADDVFSGNARRLLGL